MKIVNVRMTDEQHQAIKLGAGMAGYSVGAWMRGLSLAAARNLGVNSQLPKEPGKKKDIKARAEQAWKNLERCQTEYSVAVSSGDPEAIAAALAARTLADGAAQNLQAIVDAE